MFKTLKQFFDFCNKEDRNKLYLAIALGVIKAIFAALRMPAIAVVVQGLIEGQLTMKHLWLSLSIMVVSVLGQFLINLKTTMLQCEAGYHSCAHKRIEIAEHLRYLPMGFFNKNSLGVITNVTTNTMESLADIATRIVMITTQGILTTAVITCFVFAFDWRIGLVLAVGIVLYIIFNAVMQQATRPAAPRKHRADEDLVSQVIEYVQGIAEVKNYSMTDDTAKKLDAAITEKQGAGGVNATPLLYHDDGRFLYGLREPGFHELVYGADEEYQYRCNENQGDPGYAAYGYRRRGDRAFEAGYRTQERRLLLR